MTLAITQERLKELFDYNQDGYLVWKKTTSNRVVVGSIAGRKTDTGYISIGLNGKHQRAHRLIYLWHHGELPVGDIDHINGIRDDNRIENLRFATRSQNNANSRVDRNSISGVKGVHWNKRDGNWIARINIKPKAIWIGTFATIELASEAYSRALVNLFGDYAKTPTSI